MGVSLLDRALGWRCGLAMSVDAVGLTPADPPVHQWSALDAPSKTTANAGGAARTRDAARAAAVGELLERYAAARFPLPVRPAGQAPRGERVLGLADFSLHSPAQQAAPGFPHGATYARDAVTAAFSLVSNERVWVPAALVGTDPALGTLATSSGLAADPLVSRALLRAAQELIERDALMVAWLHGVGAPRRPLTPAVTGLSEPVGGDVALFDLTPAFSPHPVAVVAGTAVQDGRPRRAFGLACRASWAQAVEKAALEWAQGLVFAGVTTAFDSPDDARVGPAGVTDFDEHARFYTRRGDLWGRLPFWQGSVAQDYAVDNPADLAPSGAARTPLDDPGRIPTGPAASPTPLAELRDLVLSLAEHGIELLYRDLTTPDVAACGVRAVRVLSPQLVPIHGDHRWPHLGGTAADLARRFPRGRSLTGFPSPYPHPLG